MFYKRLIPVVMLFSMAGCAMPSRSLDAGGANTPLTEAAWIRNGEPLQMEEAAWYPTDEVENLLDTEMFRIGQYRDVDVYIERADVKPYARLYTLFGKSRYRAFEQQQ